MTASSHPKSGALEADLHEKNGPYELVAHYVKEKGEHRGCLWTTEKNARRSMLLTVKGTSNADAIEKLKQGFYEMAVAKAEQTPSEARTAAGWQAIWQFMNPKQIAQVMALYHAPRRRRSILELAKVAGYADHRGVNRYLGDVGFMMFREAPRRLLPDELYKDGRPVFTFALCTGVGRAENSDDGAWVWEMRPEVARGLELAGLVSPVAS